MSLDQLELARRLAALPAEKRQRIVGQLAGTEFDVSLLPIVPAQNVTMLPLSYSQVALWTTWRMAPDSFAYNLSGVLELTGHLNRAALEHVIDELVERHEVLRTVFRSNEDASPSQEVLDAAKGVLQFYDLANVPEALREERAERIASAQADSPFDLESAPACRFALLRLSATCHRLVIVVHHIVADDGSQSILIHDLAKLYNAHAAGGDSGLTPLPIQFADYAVWQRDQCGQVEIDRQLRYWKKQLGEDPAPLNLPVFRERPAVRDGRAGTHSFRLDRERLRGLREIAQSGGASVFMVMLALLELALSRHCGQSDIRVGVPVANRERAETHGLVGYFANVLVLRTQVDQRVAFMALLDDVRRAVLGAMSNQQCPLDLLVREYATRRTQGVHPLFQVKCTEVTGIAEIPSFTGLNVQLRTAGTAKLHFDLSFDFRVGEEGIDCSLLYATDILDAPTIAGIARSIEELARQVIAQPRRGLSELSGPGRHECIAERKKNYPADSVLALWLRSRAAQPQATAIRCEGDALSFARLDRLSSGLARRLIDLGVGAGVYVGLLAERSIEFVIGLLAVWKAGGAHVPLDPRLPAERLKYQISDCDARVLLSAARVGWATDIPVLELTIAAMTDVEGRDESEHPAPEPHRSQPAYVIYTSGSTGKPKGVVVHHGALANYVQGVLEQLALPDNVRSMAMASTVSADLGHTTLFGALCSGRTLHLIPAHCAFDPDRFAAYMREHQVEVLKIVPSHLQALLSAARPEDVLPAHTLILGGEATHWALLDRIRGLKQECRVINHYGPTETTVGVFTQEASAALRNAATLPIGFSLPNTQGYVLDAYLNPVPQGVTGELFLGGMNLASGYCRQSGLTADRFIASASREGERLYRTGDRARHLKDGSVEFLGRTDDQVKVRGYRVELSEIARTLKAQSEVRDAAVVARTGEDGRAQLHAYVVAGAGVPIDLSVLQGHLAMALPEYMVPSAIVILEQLPLTSNGKLDQKALPHPGRPAALYEAPAGEIEEKLAAVWAELLGVERVGRHDNFFQLGGDSILTLQIVARVRKLGIKVSPRTLMERQTVAAIAAVAEPVARSMQVDESALCTTPFELTPIQRWFFEQQFTVANHWNQSVLLEPVGAVDVEVLRRAVNQLLEHHGALRLSFREIDGRWQQNYEAFVPDTSFEAVDLSSEVDAAAAITRTADLAQRSVTLQRPFRAVWMNLGAKCGGRLLLVGHHLVVDGVSWRVLLEDFQSAYHQLCDAVTAIFPARTTSLQSWSQALQVHAQSAALRQTLPYWMAMVGESEPDLPCMDPRGSNTVADIDSVSITLDGVRTEQLLTQAPRAYRTQINDLLLSALAQTFCEWAGRDSVLIELEGHGREEVADGLDLTRTLGWFTALYPVRLTPHANPGTSIKRIKEELRQVPDKGLSYGLLRYLAPEGAVLTGGANPQVTFNYLGQLDHILDGESLWRVARERPGEDRSPVSRRRCWFDVTAQVYRRRLSIRLSYSEVLHSREQAEHLLDRYRTHLESLIEHCMSGIRSSTPSDFPLAKLTQKQLDELPIPAGHVEDLYPMTSLQKGLLFHSLQHPDTDAYLCQLRVDIDGLDTRRFRSAWQSVLERHEILRTGFLHELDLPLQWVARAAEVPLVEEDWRNIANPADALDVRAHDEQQIAGRDFLTPPLMRLLLIRVSEERHHFIWTRHHVLLDGWSTAQVIGEVLHLYHKKPLQPSTGRYRDYIEWLQGRASHASEEYWKKQLRRLGGPTQLMGALPKGNAGGAEGYVEHVESFDTEGTQRLMAFAKRERVTLNTLVQGAWALLLSRYTGAQGVIFGATMSGRPPELPGVEQLVGLFINTLPVVVEIKAGQRAGEWLRDLQAQNTVSREHEHTPLYEIQRWAGSHGHSLFDTLLVFENYPVDEALRQASEQTLRFSSLRNQDQTHYPLTIDVSHGSTLTLRYTGRRQVLAQETLAIVSKHARRLLEELVVDERRCLGEMGLASDPERMSLARWGINGDHCGVTELVQRSIERQVQRNPHAVALILGNDEITYGELNDRVNRLAHRLISLGVTPETRVGLAVERSFEMIVGLLAILKAGGAYVPLDPEYPAERLSYMLEDSGIGIVLTQTSVADHQPSVRKVVRLYLDDPVWNDEPVSDPEISAGPDNLAYVIYTSGSTGAPKGVCISHRALAEHTHVAMGYFGLTPADRMLQFSSVSFDGFIEQLFPPLCAGAAVVLRGPALWDSDTFHRELLDRRISIADLPTSYWFMLTQDFRRAGPRSYGVLRQVQATGEAMPPEGVKNWLSAGLAGVKLLNTYGPTEATVTATAFDCGAYRGRLDEMPMQMPIGAPLGGRSAYVLDTDVNLVAPEIAGELHIGGMLLARGYHRKPALTAARFVADPFSSTGGRLYRTGDVVRWNRKGQLEYLGRTDQQVKIRGFRVELGEIEAHVLAQDEVRETVVVAKSGPHGTSLVAYVVPAYAAFDESLVRERLSRTLPDYMRPDSVVVLKSLPLTPNGKLDRKALPEAQYDNAYAYESPRGAIEEGLAAIWSEVLGIERVGRHDNFFDLGGQSLLAVRLISRVRRDLDVEIKLRMVLENPTLALMSTCIAEQFRPAALRSLADNEIPPVDRAGKLSLSPVQRRLWISHRIAVDSDPAVKTAYTISAKVRLLGDLDLPAARAAIHGIVSRHEVLRTLYPEDDEGDPIVIILPSNSFEVDVVDISRWPSSQLAERMEQSMREAASSIDLMQGPVICARILCRAPDIHILVMAVHHIAFDGWSESIFMEEFIETYLSIKEGRPARLPTLEAQYVDYADWQTRRLSGAFFQDAKYFWRNYLRDAPHTSTFPSDYSRPRRRTMVGDSIRTALSPDVASALTRISQEQQVTPFMLLFATFSLLLHRELRVHDLVIGTDVAGRNHPELERLLGFFVNLIPLRSRTNASGQSIVFREWLTQTKERELAAFEYQDAPFDEIIDWVGVSKRSGHNPLVQILFVLQNEPRTHLAIPGLVVEALPSPTVRSKFDIAVFVRMAENGIHVSWVYASSLYRRETIEALSVSWHALLHQIASSPEPMEEVVALPAMSARAGDEAVSVRPQSLAKLNGSESI